MDKNEITYDDIKKLAVELAVEADAYHVVGPEGPLFVIEWERILNRALGAAWRNGTSPAS